jgi:hypothetical protein
VGVYRRYIREWFGGRVEHYRFYLFRDEQIQAGHAFSAPDDTEAMETASLVCAACSDVVAACEVWRGATCVAKVNAECGTPRTRTTEMVKLLGEMGESRRIVIRDLVDDLQCHWSCIRSSRKLVEISARLGW